MNKAKSILLSILSAAVAILAMIGFAWLGLAVLGMGFFLIVAGLAMSAWRNRTAVVSVYHNTAYQVESPSGFPA